jgi:hypothetical protein
MLCLVASNAFMLSHAAAEFGIFFPMNAAVMR